MLSTGTTNTVTCAPASLVHLASHQRNSPALGHSTNPGPDNICCNSALVNIINRLAAPSKPIDYVDKRLALAAPSAPCRITVFEVQLLNRNSEDLIEELGPDEGVVNDRGAVVGIRVVALPVALQCSARPSIFNLPTKIMLVILKGTLHTVESETREFHSPSQST